MVRIDDQILECPIYFYRSVNAALAGEKTGGTGFLVGIEIGEYVCVYAVTNAHVIRDGFAVIRINTVAGATDIVDASGHTWFAHFDEDVAVTEIELTEQHLVRWLPESIFIEDNELTYHGIAPGNNIFMVGRFINLDGAQQNTPALRFGTIAIAPREPILNALGNPCPAYVVEMHSISGYSGSPVFVHILPFEGRPMFGSYGYKAAAFGPKLLGIDSGHVRGTVENSGMSAVVPVSALRELLHRADVTEARINYLGL